MQLIRQYESTLSSAYNALSSAHDTYLNVDEIYGSIKQIRNTYADANLSTSCKVLQCTVEGSFIATRCGKICAEHNDAQINPIINGIDITTNIARDVVKYEYDQQDSRQTFISMATKTLSGTSEILLNMAKTTGHNSGQLVVLGIALSVSSTGLTVWNLFNSKNQEEKALQ